MVCRACHGHGRHLSGCAVVRREMSNDVDHTPSSLGPPQPNREGRVGVVLQSASSTVTYTTKNRGRGCTLTVPPDLLQPGAGTMTLAQYRHWRCS